MMVDIQVQNWKNFCQYHIGDWDGVWTRYSALGEPIESLKCVRTFHLSDEGTEINHHNYYTYADGSTETKTFGPYKQPLTKVLFLDNSFSSGSTAVISGSSFGFETGFRYEDRRASATVIYDNCGMLQRITIMPERLAKFMESTPHMSLADCGNWQVKSRTIRQDLIVSDVALTAWKPLDELAENYFILHDPSGVYVCCPRQLESGKEFLLAVDWHVHPGLLQRGIRYYDVSGFVAFTLQNFTLNQ